MTKHSLDLWAKEEWLRNAGWIQSPDKTWGYPNSTCRSLGSEAAYHLGQILAELDASEDLA